jgi:hypothetical protein
MSVSLSLIYGKRAAGGYYTILLLERDAFTSKVVANPIGCANCVSSH